MGGVWISDVMGESQLGNKVGLRVKYHGADWTPAEHILPAPTEDSLARIKRYRAGYRLSDLDLPETVAVWDKTCFSRTADMFSIGVYVVKPCLADVFSRFDLGEGGLTPLIIYEADLVTPATGDYYLLHFGARKNTFLPSHSNKEGHRIRSTGVAKRSTIGFTAGVEYWQTSSIIEDGDVAVSPFALQGADLWIEELISRKLFMSDALATALTNYHSSNRTDFCLKRCRVVED